MVGAGAVVLSQAVILSSWSDAKAGTIANAVLLAAVAYGYASQGPNSYRTPSTGTRSTQRSPKRARAPL